MKIVICALQRLSANGICANMVVDELIRRGHEVIWVCNRELADSVSSGRLKYVHVKPRWIDRQLAKFEDRPFLKRALILINRLGMLRALHTWPLISKKYSKRVAEATANASFDADVIVGTYTQIDAVIAANEAKKNNPQLRYIAWYLDSFTGGHGPRFLNAEEIERRGKRWNRKLLANVDAIVAMESSRRFHEEHCSGEPWFDKLHFLDLPLLNLDMASNLQPIRKRGNKKLILYMGTIPEGVRSPDYFLRVLGCIRDDSLRVLFVGDKTDRSLIKACAQDRRIEVRGRVSHEEAMRLLASADYLLTLGNRLTNMTPSKIFEYMAFRKPIVATYPIDSEPSLPYLERYGDVLLLDERGDPFIAAKRMTDFLNVSHEPISFDELTSIFWKNTPSAFCDLIETIGGKGGI